MDNWRPTAFVRIYEIKGLTVPCIVHQTRDGRFGWTYPTGGGIGFLSAELCAENAHDTLISRGFQPVES